jgi:hypothetical protein
METVGWMLIVLAGLLFLLVFACSLVCSQRREQRAAARLRTLAAMSSEELRDEARRIAAAHYAHEAATHPLLDDDFDSDAELLARLEALFRECFASGGGSAALHLGESGLGDLRDVLRCRLRRARH